MSGQDGNYDYLIIGGGFYGCCLALFLRSISKRILVVEAGDVLLNRASRVNQARIHTGFHYPRSALTAVKSMVLHKRFAEDFSEAVVDDFQMLYAIAKRRSKVSAKRFYRMFRDMGAPIQPASPSQRALFDKSMIEDAFACSEAAFDYSVLRTKLEQRLAQEGVEVRLSTQVDGLQNRENGIVAALSDNTEVTARYAFNVTYSQINAILDKAELPRAKLKHELTEIALVEPPDELENTAITVMDGPFFSCMPYPAEGLYSLTHVRYTPHESWTEEGGAGDPGNHFNRPTPDTRAAHMINDGKRYLPCLSEARHVKSIFDIKTILVKNEQDDGRPILYHQRPYDSRVISILGGKIDNIYDLFDLVRKTGPEFSAASDTLVMGRGR